MVGVVTPPTTLKLAGVLNSAHQQANFKLIFMVSSSSGLPSYHVYKACAFRYSLCKVFVNKRRWCSVWNQDNKESQSQEKARMGCKSPQKSLRPFARLVQSFHGSIHTNSLLHYRPPSATWLSISFQKKSRFVFKLLCTVPSYKFTSIGKASTKLSVQEFWSSKTWFIWESQGWVLFCFSIHISSSRLHK